MNKLPILELINGLLLSILSISWMYGLIFFNAFIPGADYLQLMETTSYVIAIFFGLLSSSIYILKFNEFSLKEKFIIPFAVVAIVYISGYSMLAGVPAVLHNFSSNKDTNEIVTVVRKQPAYGMRRCTGGFYIKRPIIKEFRVCGHSRNKWNNLKPNHKVELYGKKSFFGMEFIRY